MLPVFDGLRTVTLASVTVRMLLAVLCGGIIGILFAKLLAVPQVRALERENHFRFAYDAALPIRDKLLALTQRIYGGHNVAYTEEADREINRLTELGFGGLPVCVAKTQYSLSDDPTKLGAPQDFILTVRKVKVSAGAGFIVALTGDILTMPGLPKTPAAEAIDVDENGVISGLF